MEDVGRTESMVRKLINNCEEAEQKANQVNQVVETQRQKNFKLEQQCKELSSSYNRIAKSFAWNELDLAETIASNGDKKKKIERLGEDKLKLTREVAAVKAKTIELENYLTNLKSKLTARSESLNQENALAGSFEKTKETLEREIQSYQLCEEESSKKIAVLDQELQSLNEIKDHVDELRRTKSDNDAVIIGLKKKFSELNRNSNNQE
ncbi:uncharacterized protein LOC142350973 [Convolutriloba macropyga]|uniref:uncharacterized protein LOC142350973 n=1 Tax=Convolutriloba macropyga TaxID=536237 RepID=UPI003F5234EC